MSTNGYVREGRFRKTVNIVQKWTKSKICERQALRLIELNFARSKILLGPKDFIETKKMKVTKGKSGKTN